MMSYTWLSFRDPDKNLNLGCVIMKADNLDDAVQRAWDLKLNPGGEVMSVVMTDEEVEEEGLIVEKLYSKEELVKRGYKTAQE